MEDREWAMKENRLSILHPLSSILVFSPDRRPAVLSALAALIVYAVTLGGTYVYDDRYIVQADPRIWGSKWGEIWTKDYFNGGADNLYRPLVSMTYAIQAKVHGTKEEWAWLFHAVNWLLHAAVSAAVAELARRLTYNTAAATVAGVIFAVHPVHVEAVANIVGRAELMCALGVIGAVVLFLRRLTIARALAIWGCLLLALLSKEQGMLLPLMMVAAIPIRRGVGARVSSESTGELKAKAQAKPSHFIEYASPSTPWGLRFNPPALLLMLLILWTLAGYLFVRENTLHLRFWWDRAFLDRMINPIVDSQGIDRLLMPFVLFGRYVMLLVAPVRLLPDYGGQVIGSAVHFSDPHLYLGAAAAIALAVVCLFATRKRDWRVLFCLICFALCYGMIGNIVTLIGTNFAERLMYLPSAFVCILIGIGAVRIPRRIAIAGALVIAILFSIRTISYAQRWNDPQRLFRAAIAQQPNCVRLYMLLAEELERGGDLDGSAEMLTQARTIEPTYYRAWLNSAHLAMRRYRFAEAVDFVRQAQRLAPTVEGGNLLTRAAVARNAATRPGMDEGSFFP